LISLCNSLEIKCEFKYEEWVTLGSVYTCHVYNLTVRTPHEDITKIIGNHIDGKSNKDVIKINIEQQACEFLPNKLETFFPNLEGYRVANSGLVKLYQIDFSVFPKLRSCDMWNNYLSDLDSNLFEKNSEIEYLYFGDNQINTVGHNILKPLTKLSKAVFQGNKCLNKNADTHLEVPELQKVFNKDCSPDRFWHELDISDEEVDRIEKHFHLIALREEIKAHNEEVKKSLAKIEKVVSVMGEEQKQKGKNEEEKQQTKQESSSLATFWVVIIIIALIVVPVAILGLKVFYSTRGVKRSRFNDTVEILPNGHNEATNEHFVYKMQA
jgi:hypothetical protein